jgi:hypothetical protein
MTNRNLTSAVDMSSGETRRPRFVRNGPSTALFTGWGPRLHPQLRVRNLP